MPQLLPAAAAWAAAAWSSAVTATAVGLTNIGVMAAIGEGATIALAGGIVKTGAMLALSAAATALMRPNTPSTGTTLDFKPDPKAPVRGAMGYTAIGGNKAFQATWGYKRVAMSLGVALSLGPIDQVPRFEADGTTVTFSGPQNEATGFYAADMWQKTTLGLPGDAALLPPTGLKYGNPGLTGWGPQHAAPQVAFSFWTMVLAKNPEDRDIFTNGVPDPRWIGRWMKVWDPRKDSTYPGGSGPQRRDDWRTWEWSENPYVHALAWYRGHFKLNLDGSVDRTKRIAGIGAPDAAIDMPAFVEGMNVADANAWTISGEWSSSDPKAQVAMAMLQAGGGQPISRGAQISVLVNMPRVSTYTYTKADLIGQAQIKPLTPRRDRKNTIIPRYKSEANNWEYVAAGEVTDAGYRAEDRGEPRSTEVEYIHVRSAKQAAQLAAYDLVTLREGLTVTLPSKVHLMHVHAGDCITVDDPELAMVGQKFVVMRTTTDYKTASVTLELRSETDAKHAFALGQASKAPPSPGLSAVDPKYVPPPVAEDWTVLPKPPGGGGVSQPIFVIEAPVETTDIVGVIIKHGPSASGPWTDGYEGSPRADGRYEVAGLTPGQSYCVSLQYVAKNGAKSDPDIKCGVIAGDLIAEDTAHLNGTPASEITDRLQSVEAVAAATQQGVADLELVFGDTVSAAESALAAGEAANLAVLKAGDAAAAAAASNVSAGIATTKADEAGNSATAANAAKVAAESARDGAAGSAAASATSAASAATSATNAGNSATASSGSATAAATSAGNAATFAGQASTSAAAANAASITAGTAASTAQGVANRLLPDRVSVPSDFINIENWGAPDTVPPLTEGTNVATADQGVVRRFQGSVPVGSRGWKKVEAGRLYRTTAVSRITTGASGNQVRTGFGIIDASGAYIGWNLEILDRTSPTAWLTNQRTLNGDDILASLPNAVYIRAVAHSGITSAGAGLPGVVWDLSTLRLEDVTESVSAATSAATAIAQSSSASTSAASAAISANLAASIGTGSLNKNSMFVDWTGALPTTWSPWGGGAGTSYAKVSGINGAPNALKVTSDGAEVGVLQAGHAATSASGGEYLVLEAEIRLVSGSLVGAGLLVERFNAAGNAQTGVNVNLNFATEKDVSGVVRGAGVSGARYRFAKLVDARAVNTAQYLVYALTRWTGFGAAAPCEIEWSRASIRAATPEEIAAGTTLPAVEAQLAVTAAVAADAQTRLSSARFEVIAAAGSDPAQLLIRADGTGSLAGLVATEISFANVVGGVVVKAMKLIGGEVFFMRPIYIDVGANRLIVGPGGTWVLWFGSTDRTAATATRTNGVFCLGTDGKVYYGSSELSGGARSGGRTFQSGAGGASAETVIDGIAAGSFIEMTGSLDGGSLSANTALNGRISLFEVNGSGSRQVYAEDVVVASSGLQRPNGSWSAEGASVASIRVPATKTGSVTYRVQFTRLSGSTHVDGAVLSGSVFITPPA